MMALSAIGGAAAYGLTNRFRNENNAHQHTSKATSYENNHVSSQQNAQYSSKNGADQSFADLTDTAKSMGMDNSAIQEFTNAIKDDLK